ncbi:hypothetical protein EON63_24265 [archaeon]|nr:MAG: hypothetical protein EON63_24265 [archaeon]
MDEGYTLAQLDRDLPTLTDKRIPCALCDHVFPLSQLVGKISLQAVCNWKNAHNVSTAPSEVVYTEDKSVYLRALDSVKRLQIVSLCVFCTQFFDVNMGDYIEPELIKQDVGVEDILKGPLNRPSHIYKKLLRSFSLEKTYSYTHADPHTYSLADSHTHTHSNTSLDRPQSRESYEDKIRNLKSRSLQKVVTLAQARTLRNKYVSVEKIIESMESVGQKSKRAVRSMSSVCMYADYVYVVWVLSCYLA